MRHRLDSAHYWSIEQACLHAHTAYPPCIDTGLNSILIRFTFVDRSNQTKYEVLHVLAPLEFNFNSICLTVGMTFKYKLYTKAHHS